MLRHRRGFLLTGILAAFIAVTLLTVADAGAIQTDATITKYSYDSDSPFFETYYDMMTVDNDTSIDRWFDTLPQTTNYSNFCSHDTAVYENINGKTVTVDVLNRHYLDSLDDPNFAEGMLLYQCIQYKIAHPEKEVHISFSTYRMSITASVCLRRDSKYFGYMRSLFDEEYDTHGFVRIAFMLVEAARMGIHVTFVPHIGSYGVAQYSATASKGYATKSEPSYTTYFSDAVNKTCYSSYASGKKVSAFMKYSRIMWNVNDYGGTDMMHTKICAVSNYIDKDNIEHSSGLYMTSSNLDANNYLGRNGNGWGQSGVVISDHDLLYKTAYNYIELLAKNNSLSTLPKFRDSFKSVVAGQVELYKNGQGDNIQDDVRLIYLGSQNDAIFELVFSPMLNYEQWEVVSNPYAKWFSQFNQGSAPYVFTWNSVNYGSTGSFGRTMEEIIRRKFHDNPTIDNRLYIHLDNFEKTEEYDDLVVGQNIGFKLIETTVTKIHSKDMLFSYNKDGERHYISIISSCNFHSGAFWFQSNHTLVIHETSTIGHLFYDSFGNETTKGAIIKS